MTIKECIDAVDNLKPNQYTIEEKVMWLSFLDGIIIDEVLKTHEGYDGRYDTFSGYSNDRLSETLIVPNPYDRLYTAFLKMKIDEENGETQRYNNSARLYNSYLAEFKKHYNKTHMPLSGTGKASEKKIDKVAVGLSDEERESILADLKYTATELISDALSQANMYDVVTNFAQNNVQMLKGKDGKDGKDGEKGYTPVKGIDYNDGIDGKPFTYADFTEEQLASLKGEKGDKGEMGAQGPRGIQGIQGIKGDKGERGYKGDKGDRGASAGANLKLDGEGENITLTESIEAPFVSMKVCGKTKQLKSTGKNMIPFPFVNRDLKEYYPAGYSTTDKGITFLVNEDGSVSFWGTAIADAKFRIAQDYGYTERTHLPPGTYIINAYNSKCYTNTFSISFAYKHTNKGVSLSAFDYNTAVKTFTIGDAITDAYWVAVDIVVKKGYRADYETVYPMLEKSNVASGYEPYTNGIPSPSPEFPQPMNSAGKDGSVDIGISNGDESERQTLSIDTPNGLRGVPVATGGNYTDEKGQQWLCDEIDFDKGVYIKRVEETVVPGYFDVSVVNLNGKLYMQWISSDITRYASGGGLCTVATYSDYNEGYANNTFNLEENGNGMVDMILLGEYYDDFRGDEEKIEEFKDHFNNKPMILILKNPVEIPLSYSELERFRALRTYEDVTMIGNKDGAHLKVEYSGDARKYIDRKIAELEAVILNNI